MDIHDIPTSQIEKQRYQFWSKKWWENRSTMPMIDQGSFLGFACNNSTFHGSETQHATQKVSRVKGPRKKKGMGQQAKLRTVMANKKSPNLGLCVSFPNFAPNPRKFSRFGEKSCLSKM